MKTVCVRYKVRPELADENQRLVEEVFAQLARDLPAGLQYQTFRMADGVSFLHIAARASAEDSPLLKLDTFQAFVAGIKARCDEPPVQTEMTQVGRYDAAEAPARPADAPGS